jgi:hypothetical protein
MCTSSFENIKINAKIVHLNLFIFYFQSNTFMLLSILYWYINQTQSHYIRFFLKNLDQVCFCVLKAFLKKIKFFFIFLFQINIFLVFLDHFDTLI